MYSTTFDFDLQYYPIADNRLDVGPVEIDSEDRARLSRVDLALNGVDRDSAAGNVPIFDDELDARSVPRDTKHRGEVRSEDVRHLRARGACQKCLREREHQRGRGPPSCDERPSESQAKRVHVNVPPACAGAETAEGEKGTRPTNDRSRARGKEVSPVAGSAARGGSKQIPRSAFGRSGVGCWGSSETRLASGRCSADARFPASRLRAWRWPRRVTRRRWSPRMTSTGRTLDPRRRLAGEGRRPEHDRDQQPAGASGSHGQPHCGNRRGNFGGIATTSTHVACENSAERC